MFQRKRLPTLVKTLAGKRLHANVKSTLNQLPN